MIQYHPIGVIRTQYTDRESTPAQAAFAQQSMMAVAELDEAFTEGLSDLEGFSHLILIFHFHQARPAALKQTPRFDDTPRGVFSTRSPHRPNPIGMSIVELVKIEDNRLYFNHADMLDRTPLLDIKPFIPAIDHREQAVDGWVAGRIPPDKTQEKE